MPLRHTECTTDHPAFAFKTHQRLAFVYPAPGPTVVMLQPQSGPQNPAASSDVGWRFSRSSPPGLTAARFLVAAGVFVTPAVLSPAAVLVTEELAGGIGYRGPHCVWSRELPHTIPARVYLYFFVRKSSWKLSIYHDGVSTIPPSKKKKGYI